MNGTNVGSLYYEVTADTSELLKQSGAAQKELDRLGKGLEGAGASAEKASGRFRDAAGRLREANGQFVKVGESAAQAGSAVEQAAQNFNAITRAVKVLAAALAAVKIVQLADEFRLLTARIEVAAGSVERGAEAMRELEAISARTMTSVAGNAEVFQRLNQSLLQMGGTQADTLRVTELLAKAIKVSGASAVEAKAAMLQFGQALGSGKLAGDELRSLMETAPYLMRQLADGIGVPVGSLKKLGEEGKLTADVVVNALGKAAAKINEDFAKFPQTFDAAFSALENAAMKASKALDDQAGASTALIGITKGAAEAVDILARQFTGVNDEASKLSRNTAIKTWADATLQVLSYVADAADLVVRGFRQAGVAIYGMAAAAGSAATGDLKLAGSYLTKMKEDLFAIGNAPYAGVRMRQTAQALANTPEANPLDQRLAATTPSKLKAPAGSPDKGGAKFDAVGYLLDLEGKTKTAYERIDAIEAESMHKAEELRKAGKISAKQYEEARTLIQAKAAQERAELAEKDRLEQVQRQADFEAASIARDKKAAEDRARGQALARDAIGDADPVAKLQLELEAKSALLAQYAALDQENLELYAQARVALEQETDRKIREIRNKEAEDRQRQQSQMLQNYGNLFGGLADLAKTFGSEQSRTYRALFAVSKAFAIADSIIKIQQGIANASALPFPMNLGAMATVAAQTAGILATIRGTQFGGGRQYGGPAMAGTLYRVNEGGRPEMFTAANGSQYMMPTADGRVTPAGEVGAGSSGPAWQIIINNAPAGTTASVDNSARVVQVSVAEVASQIAERRGQVWGALRSTNVQGRVG